MSVKDITDIKLLKKMKEACNIQLDRFKSDEYEKNVNELEIVEVKLYIKDIDKRIEDLTIKNDEYK